MRNVPFPVSYTSRNDGRLRMARTARRIISLRMNVEDSIDTLAAQLARQHRETESRSVEEGRNLLNTGNTNFVDVRINGNERLLAFDEKRGT